MITITINRKNKIAQPRLPVVPYLVGMVNNINLSAWKDPAYASWTLLPQSQKLCAKGTNPSRGRNIPVLPSAWRIIKRNNDVRGYDYARSVGMVWINRAYVGSGYNIGDPYGGSVGGIVTDLDPVPLAEPIIFPNNFIAITGATATHYQIDAYYYTRNFDAIEDNWFTHPWRWVKCTAINRAGEIFNVMNGVHCYIPQMYNDGNWVEKEVVEMLPALPVTVTYKGAKHLITGYCLLGACVYGHAENVDIPLRLVRHAGEWIEPCPEWHLATRPVPTETRPEWRYPEI